MTKALVTSRIGPDSRGEQRRGWGRKASLSITLREALPAQTIDISASGMALMTDYPVPLNTLCTVTVTFLLGETISRLNVSGSSVYCILVGTRSYRTGIQFGNLDAATTTLIHQIMTR